MEGDMLTVADLKAKGLWKNVAHMDGSDKRGRFWINIHQAEIAGRTVRASDKQYRAGGIAREVTYTVDGTDVPDLATLCAYLNNVRWTAGDDKEARDD